MIGKRISSNSIDKQEFDKAKPAYEKALLKSGFEAKLEYHQCYMKRRRKRSQNVIYFNPPFNINVKNNVGQYLLQLILKHFSPGHKYRSLFNRNTLKLSYSCMPNVENIIQKYNAKILERGKAESKLCN